MTFYDTSFQKQLILVSGASVATVIQTASSPCCYYQSKKTENAGFEASVNGVIFIQGFVKIGQLAQELKLAGLQEHKSRKQIPWKNRNACFFLLYEDHRTFYHISLNYSQNGKCFRQSCKRNQNTHFQFNNLFENRAIYEILWKNTVEWDRQ